MIYTSEGLTEDLAYSAQAQHDANERAQQRAIDCQKNPRKYTISDLKEGQRVIRRWCGERTKKAVLMQVTKMGF